VSTCTSDSAGISAIELLLGLSLALCLAVAVAPLWTTSQSLAAQEGDETIWTLQSRVAVARFEKDLRSATAAGASFPTGSAVLQAGPFQLVLLEKTEEGAPILVEWEIVGRALMRRWGPCPTAAPTTFAHSLYLDHKTMLERVDPARSRFVYEVAGSVTVAPIPGADLPQVDAVKFELCSRDEGQIAPTEMVAAGGVGR
jgi:hypothetical protein